MGWFCGQRSAFAVLTNLQNLKKIPCILLQENGLMISPRKLLFISLIGVIGLGQLLAGCSPSKSSKVLSATPTPLPTLAVASKPTYKVERGEIIDQVIFDGRIVPVKQQELYFKISGRVRKVYVQEGDEVTAGTVLADLEAADNTSREQAQRELNVKRAQIRLDMAKIELDNFKSTGAIYDSNYQKTLFMLTSQVSLAQLDLDEANLNYQDTSKNLSDAQIIAPFDGKVMTLSTEDGKQVEGYSPVAVIADVNALEVSADSNTDLIGKISENMKASVASVDTSSTIKPAEGFIRRLPYVLGSSSSSTTSKDTTIRVSTNQTPQQLGYKLGNLVKVTVVLNKKENVLTLPASAIRDFEGRTFVLVKNETSQERVDVKVGIKEEDKVEITEGLKEGMVVIAP
jgi:membrane fusion protein, macrolide-specific efflux system